MGEPEDAEVKTDIDRQLKKDRGEARDQSIGTGLKNGPWLFRPSGKATRLKTFHRQMMCQITIF